LISTGAETESAHYRCAASRNRRHIFTMAGCWHSKTPSSFSTWSWNCAWVRRKKDLVAFLRVLWCRRWARVAKAWDGTYAGLRLRTKPGQGGSTNSAPNVGRNSFLLNQW